jgi:hypothetical protein
MLLDVAADHLCRDLVTYGASKIAIFPEFSTPQAPLDLREFAKDRSGAQTLEPCDHLGDGIPWGEGTKEMDMIRTHLHLLNGNIILLGNIGKEFLYPPLHLALQHVASVLGRPDQMIERIVDSMGCSSEDHVAIVHPNLSWQQALSPLPCRSFPPAASSGAA